MTILGFTKYDLTPADIVSHWKFLLEDEGSDLIRDELAAKNYITATDTIGTIIGEVPVAKYPTIRIIAQPKETEWFATRTRIDKFPLFFDCCARKAAPKEQIDLFIQDFTGLLHNWLIRFNALQQVIHNTSVTFFDSWAGNVTTGYSSDGAMRIGRINWWCKIANPYAVDAMQSGPPTVED